MERLRMCSSGGLLACLILLVANVHALVEDDMHVTADVDAVRLDIDRRVYDEITGFLDQGYPPASIYLHGLSMGISIDDLAFLMTLAQAERGQEFLDVAVGLLPDLPGWACRMASDADSRYADSYHIEDMEGEPTIATVSERFFEHNERLTPFPDWRAGGAHFEAPTSELVDLVGRGANDRPRWYRVGNDRRPRQPGVFVALYRDDRRIVVDGNLGQVLAAAERGAATVPVIILYNDARQRPVSDFGDGAGEDGTFNAVLDAFFDERLESTPVPDWKNGDFHLMATIDELEQWQELPDADDLPEARFRKLRADLHANGFRNRPVLLTVYRNGRRLLVDEPERVAVAREIGIAQVPVVFLYHGIDRQPCGVVPGRDCVERIRQAVEAAAPEPVELGTPRLPGPSLPPPGAGGNPSPS